MNKIFGILLLAAGCLFTASCSDDSNDYVAPSALKVLKSNTYFTADADTSVVVASTPIIEASTEATHQLLLLQLLSSKQAPKQLG